jgi:spore coat polysaccharide biosynthesis predicted glycosyltransferase SpsG
MGDTFTVVFRVSGGPVVGFGHLRRCWTLAAALRPEATVHFVADSDEAVEALAKAGFAARKESDPFDLDMTIRLLRETPENRVCVVDSPSLGETQLEQLSRKAPVICIDDTGSRRFPVEAVVNGSAGAQRLDWKGNPDTLFLAGPDYILLRPEFAGEPVRKTAPAIRRLLLLTGGGNTGNLAERLAAFLLKLKPEAEIEIVTGPFGKTPRLTGETKQRVRTHKEPKEIRSLMMETDLALSAGGQTCYELAATATPAIGFLTAENQRLNLKGLSEAGTLISIGSPDEAGFWERIREAVHRLEEKETRATMSSAGRKTVDGKGTQRVAQQIRSMALKAVAR